jgi:hypothetical protein
MQITSKQAVCGAVFGVINGVQHEPRPDHRIAGICAALLLACRARGLDLSQVIESTTRVLKDAEVYAPANLRAANDYVRNEL